MGSLLAGPSTLLLGAQASRLHERAAERSGAQREQTIDKRDTERTTRRVHRELLVNLMLLVRAPLRFASLRADFRRDACAPGLRSQLALPGLLWAVRVAARHYGTESQLARLR